MRTETEVRKRLEELEAAHRQYEGKPYDESSETVERHEMAVLRWVLGEDDPEGLYRPWEGSSLF